MLNRLAVIDRRTALVCFRCDSELNHGSDELWDSAFAETQVLTGSGGYYRTRSTPALQYVMAYLL